MDADTKNLTNEIKLLSKKMDQVINAVNSLRGTIDLLKNAVDNGKNGRELNNHLKRLGDVLSTGNQLREHGKQ